MEGENMSENFIACTQTHPTSGDVCALDIAHVQHSDARVKQHVSANGVKWPLLCEIDPAEGYNDFVTYRL
jgi:hypothetical protein